MIFFPLHQLIRLGRLEIHIALLKSQPVNVRILPQGYCVSILSRLNTMKIKTIKPPVNQEKKWMNWLIFSFFANSYYFGVNSHRGQSFRQEAFIRGAGGGGSNTILTALRGRSQEQRCWKKAYIGWFTVFSKDPEGGAWLSKCSSGVVVESACTNDAKLPWVALHSNLARCYLSVFIVQYSLRSRRLEIVG